MKKLYCVEITVMVMAENKEEAAEIASREALPESCEANEAFSVPSEWYGAIPFGADDEKTCAQILKHQRELY